LTTRRRKKSYMSIRPRNVFLPIPDEESTGSMDVALEMLFRSGSPLSVTLPMITTRRKIALAVQYVWVNSSLRRGDVTSR
jgi:hypothetical protein